MPRWFPVACRAGSYAGYLPAAPQLLGRADNLKDYVQRGCDEAWTEITLSGGPGQRDMVVRRDIKQVRRDDGSSGYSSKWRLNGELGGGRSAGRSPGTEHQYKKGLAALGCARQASCVPQDSLTCWCAANAQLQSPAVLLPCLTPAGRDVNQAEVHDLISGLNIQFDNLCQVGRRDDGLAEFEGRWTAIGGNAWTLAIALCYDTAATQSSFDFLHGERRSPFCSPTSSKHVVVLQFLPQDRVVEFARMDPYELLQATQKAIGDAHLHDQHQRLIAKREEAKTRGVVRV